MTEDFAARFEEALRIVHKKGTREKYRYKNFKLFDELVPVLQRHGYIALKSLGLEELDISINEAVAFLVTRESRHDSIGKPYRRRAISNFFLYSYLTKSKWGYSDLCRGIPLLIAGFVFPNREFYEILINFSEGHDFAKWLSIGDSMSLEMELINIDDEYSRLTKRLITNKLESGCFDEGNLNNILFAMSVLCLQGLIEQGKDSLQAAELIEHRTFVFLRECGVRVAQARECSQALIRYALFPYYQLWHRHGFTAWDMTKGYLTAKDQVEIKIDPYSYLPQWKSPPVDYLRKDQPRFCTDGWKPWPFDADLKNAMDKEMAAVEMSDNELLSPLSVDLLKTNKAFKKKWFYRARRLVLDKVSDISFIIKHEDIVVYFLREQMRNPIINKFLENVFNHSLHPSVKVTTAVKLLEIVRQGSSGLMRENIEKIFLQKPSASVAEKLHGFIDDPAMYISKLPNHLKRKTLMRDLEIDTDDMEDLDI